MFANNCFMLVYSFGLTGLLILILLYMHMMYGAIDVNPVEVFVWGICRADREVRVGYP